MLLSWKMDWRGLLRLHGRANCAWIISNGRGLQSRRFMPMRKSARNECGYARLMRVHTDKLSRSWQRRSSLRLWVERRGLINHNTNTSQLFDTYGDAISFGSHSYAESA